MRQLNHFLLFLSDLSPSLSSSPIVIFFQSIAERMHRRKSIVEEPTFYTLPITSALSIAYTVQVFLLTGAVLFTSPTSFLRLFTVIFFYALTALFITVFFISVIRQNRALLLISVTSQVTALLYTIISAYCMAKEPIFRNILPCFFLLLVHLETPLIVYLTKRGSGYFKRLYKADYFVRESIASIKIARQFRALEVVELSPSDLDPAEHSMSESETQKEEIDPPQDCHLPAPVNKFHSVSLDSYHDCKEN